MIRNTRSGRSSQAAASGTPRRSNRVTRNYLGSATESSAGEEPFIPSSSVPLSTPTGDARPRRPQRQSAMYAAATRREEALASEARRASQRPARPEDVGNGAEESPEDGGATPRARLRSSLAPPALRGSQRERHVSVALPPASNRSDRSGTYRSRFSDGPGARLPSSPPSHRLRRPMHVRQSLGPNQSVMEMGLSRRADMVVGVAEDCIVKLLKWSAGADEQARAKDAFQTLFRYRQTYIFAPSAPPFPELSVTMNNLAPSLQTRENFELLGRAIQDSNLATWLYAVLQPDAAGELLLAGQEREGDSMLSVAADRKGKGRVQEDDEDHLVRRVRMRNELLLLAWRRFWFVVVPREDRESESALTLWLDFASFIVLNWRRPTLDPLARVSSTLPSIPTETIRALFSRGVITQYGQWSQTSLANDSSSADEDESQAARSAVQNRWRTLAKRRLAELEEKDARVLDRQFVWSRWQQEAVAFVGSEVVNASDLLQSQATGQRMRSTSVATSVKRRLSEVDHEPHDTRERRRRERDVRRRSNGRQRTSLNGRRHGSPERERSLSAVEADDEGQGEGNDDYAVAETLDEDESENPANGGDARHSETVHETIRPPRNSNTTRTTPTNGRNRDAAGTATPRPAREDGVEEVKSDADMIADGAEFEDGEKEDDGPDDFVDFDMFADVAREMQEEADRDNAGAAADARQGGPEQDLDGRMEAEAVEAARQYHDGIEDGQDFQADNDGHNLSDDGEAPFLPSSSDIDDDVNTEGSGNERNQEVSRQPSQRFTSRSTQAAKNQRAFNFAARQAEAEQIEWDDSLGGEMAVKNEEDIPAGDKGSADQADDEDANTTLRPDALHQEVVIEGNQPGVDPTDSDLDQLDASDDDIPNVVPPLGETPNRSQNTSPTRPIPAPTRSAAIIPRKRTSVIPDGFASASDTEDEQDRQLLTHLNDADIKHRDGTPIQVAPGIEGRNASAGPSNHLMQRNGNTFDWEVMLPAGGRYSQPIGAYRQRAKSKAPLDIPLPAENPEKEEYMVDEDGNELEPIEEYVMPRNYKAPPSNLHGRVPGTVSQYQRLSGPRRWTPAQALLLYRTCQQVPITEPYPLRVVNYLHGEFGKLSQALALFSPQHMKDKMRVIVEKRRNNGWPVVGRARMYAGKGTTEQLEYFEELEAAAEGEEEHHARLNTETTRQWQSELEEERQRKEREETEWREGIPARASAAQKARRAREKTAAEAGKRRARREVSATDEDELDSTASEGEGDGERVDQVEGQQAKTARRPGSRNNVKGKGKAVEDSTPKKKRQQPLTADGFPDAREMVGSDTEFTPKKRKTSKRPATRARPATEEEGEGEGRESPAADEPADGADEEPEQETRAAYPRKARQTLVVEMTKNGPRSKGTLKASQPAPPKRGRGRPRKVAPIPPVEADDDGADQEESLDAPITDPLLIQNSGKKMARFSGGPRGKGKNRGRGGTRAGTTRSPAARTVTPSGSDGAEDDLPDFYAGGTPDVEPEAIQQGRSTRSGRHLEQAQQPKTPKQQQPKQRDERDRSGDHDESFIEAAMQVVASSPRTTRSGRNQAPQHEVDAAAETGDGDDRDSATELGTDAEADAADGVEKEADTQATEEFIRQRQIELKVLASDLLEEEYS